MTTKLFNLAFLLLFTSCINTSQTAKTLEEAAEEEDIPDYTLSKEEYEIISSSNAFGLKLFQQLSNKENEKSIVFSPTAVIYSLNMLNNGAAGKTKQALCHALGYPEKKLDEVNKLNKKILIGQRRETFSNLGVSNPKDKGSSNGYMVTANFMALNEATELLPEYQKALQDYYFTNIIASANKQQERIQADSLCAKITKGDITTLPIDVSTPYSAQIINAVALRIPWSYEFMEESTDVQTFYKQDGKQTKVHMMHTVDQDKNFRGYEGKEYKVLTLGMQNGFNMYVVLPNKGYQLRDIINNFKDSTLYKLTELHKQYDEVEIALPKFSTSIKLPLKELYTKSGLGVLFSQQAADFSQMSPSPLYIDKVYQQIRLDVNEKGVAAKAVQSTSMMTLGINTHPTRFTFTADHPFFYYITDQYGNICFMGKFMGE